jgi:hypothetical protein
MISDEDRQMAQRAVAKISCPYCGSVISAQQIIRPGHCGAPDCFTTHIVKGERAREDQRDSDYRERQADARTKARGKVMQAADALASNPEDVSIAVVPFQNEPLEVLSEEERERFQTHLEHIVEQAFAVEPGAIDLSDYVPGTGIQSPVLAAGCAACQGHCCKLGRKNNAFLTRKSVYYVRQNNPELDPQDVIDHYLNELPETSVKEACVYQGHQGCTLERRWRGPVCNTFQCYDLNTMEALADEQTNVALAIVGINDSEPEKVMVFSDRTGLVEIETN